MAQPTLLDVDPGCDDAVALAAALGTDGIDLRAVTTVAGNSALRNSTRNALATLELLDASVPVAAGCADPFVEPLETAEHVQGAGGIRGDLPEPTFGPVDEHAASRIVDCARKIDDLTVIAMGPLTNLAVALALEPDLPELLAGTYVMGGAAFAQGNRTPAAEANFYTDPAAARKVVSELSPKVVGLDVTREAQPTEGAIEQFSNDDRPARRTVGAWLDYYPDELLAERGYETSPQHDAVAVTAAVTEAVTFERYPVDVIDERGRARGALFVDDVGSAGYEATADVAVSLDVAAFREFLVGSIEDALAGA